MKRVVVTGMGAVSAFGAGSETLWQSLLAGKNGISHINHLPIKGDIVSIAATMPSMEEHILANRKLAAMSTADPSIKKFFLAIEEAVNQSGIDFSDPVYQDTACMIADRPYSPTMDVDTYLPTFAKAITDGEVNLKAWLNELRKCPTLATRTQVDDADSINHFTSRYYDLTGPSLSIGTACASGNNAIGEAFEKIRRGRMTSAIVGGAYDFDLNAMIGFTRIGALTTNPDIDTACRPFDANRSGFVMGSGCGVLILEELESAQKRGATILAEVTGYGSYTDGYRATDPDPEGRAACRTLAGALNTAGLKPEQIDYINAHGTSTKMNDKTETNAIKKVFGEQAYRVPISSTKSMIGHGIMAAGALEAIACINAMRDGVIHGTRNYQTPDPELDLDYVGEGKRTLHVRHAMSNNFGFGGQNATVIFSKFGDEE
ncbi:beta-ketoacyl-[acyl-carrier-protein] synthase family protein [Vibrio sp. S9_S30]|uniref:beta-ketoacyl-[acyl-carrier-protein] synthase family protein n=1 Tax=Vibrio sp. S9_S30 TaxID=2720226 RepID=UPI00167FF1C7|nr:beta-ketoacyl-[acyl-carrier-protein] synthase family protein [Vibrio sp. S9_S30]MBD1556596.1 beta-ketoacyl-[acyl-carrier-protein] synthase family protein [Vibrio sp. S9_S30]